MHCCSCNKPRRWEVMPNSKHYLLGFWAAMVSPVILLQASRRNALFISAPGNACAGQGSESPRELHPAGQLGFRVQCLRGSFFATCFHRFHSR